MRFRIPNLAAALSLALVASLHGQAASPRFDWLAWDDATGDWRGIRPVFQDHGVKFFASYTAEVWGNTTGGLQPGSVYTGNLQFGATVDLEKLVHWKGASLNTTWLWLNGRDPSQDLVGNFLTVSSIAGFETLRMCDLWFQQKLLNDTLSLRLGQLNADGEFAISDYAALFINSTFGWPPFLYTNIPNGGPAYPMGILGARLAWTPREWFTFQTALFQGNVFAQDVDRHGFRWRLNSETGYLWMSEAQFRWNHQDDAKGLAGQLKAGFWYDTSDFPSAAPDSNKTYQGNYGLYLILDQQLFQEPAPPAGKDSPAASRTSGQGLGWFGRIAFSPADRNFTGFYFDTGFTYQGLIPTRDNDTLGIAFGYAQLTQGVADTLLEAGETGVGAEMVLETTYQAQLASWLVVQPDLQFIINPGGSQSLDNAFVIGARLSITF